MFNKKSIFIVIGIILILFLYIKGTSMRRDMPFQEIVPLDKGIAVINAGNWFTKDISVSLKSKSKSLEAEKYDDNGMCLFEDLNNDEIYEVTIKRTDFKGKLLYKKIVKEVTPKETGSDYIVLVGASVGKSWKFDEVPKRTKISGNYILGNRTKYDFDKGNEIKALTQLPTPVKAAIIKECAAYYPRDINESKTMVKGWVAQLRSKGIIPVLATVVPVTKEHDKEHPKRFDSIIEYNDFIRRYAYREKIEVLDLEKAVRDSEAERHLSLDFAQEDGLHLNKKAYEQLDTYAVELLNGL